VGHAIFVHFRQTFLELLDEDVRAKRFELLPLDFLLPAYLPYRDFRLWLASSGNSVSARSAAGA
jgi:hypothetical protein